MAIKRVWPGAVKSNFKWAMGGVKAKVGKPGVKTVGSSLAKPTISNTVNTKPIQVKKPMKRF